MSLGSVSSGTAAPTVTWARDKRDVLRSSIREAKQALASGQPLATEDTFATVSTRYIEYQRKQCRAGHLSAQELRRQTDIVEKNLLPFFGSTKLAAIRPAKINAYIEARTCEVAAKKRTS